MARIKIAQIIFNQNIRTYARNLFAISELQSGFKSLYNILKVWSSEISLNSLKNNTFIFCIIISLYLLTDVLNHRVKVSQPMEVFTLRVKWQSFKVGKIPFHKRDKVFVLKNKRGIFRDALGWFSEIFFVWLSSRKVNDSVHLTCI